MNTMIKKVLLGLLAIVLFALVTLSRTSNTPTQYQIEAKLHSVAENGDTILKDDNGKLWEVTNYYNLIDGKDKLLLVIDMGDNSDDNDDSIVAIYKYIKPSMGEEN